MWRAVLVNVIAVALVIGAFASIPYFVGPDLPRFNRLAVQALALIFVIGRLAMLFRPAPPRAAGRVAWPFSSPLMVWAAVGIMTAAMWLWMPYADEGVLLVGIVGQICTATVHLIATIQPPPSRGRRTLAPLALPASIVLYLMVYPNRFSLALGIFLAAYAVAIVVLQRFVQQAVDDAHAARQTAEAALVQAAAERDAKTRFLASASHDLGQPLQAARLFFDQAMRGPDPAQRERAARRVGWAFDTTEQLLHRMLDHLRLESGTMEAHPERLALGPLIARLAEMNEPAARLAGVKIVALPSRLEANADPQLVARALGNLVANSLRHAKARRVLIGARRSAGRVRLWVIDDGVGISPTDAPRLFDDYVQGSNHGDEVRGGFGLGLASAQRMANLMDGEIALEGKWLNGSAFWLELPAADALAA